MFAVQERAFDGNGLAALERLFRGLTRTQSGIGCETASDVARLDRLGALMASRTLVRAMIHSASFAGLLLAEPLVRRLERLVKEPAAFMETL